MRRSTAASFVVAAFALLAVGGCGDSASSVPAKQVATDTPPKETTPGGPPGIVKGVVQIHRISGNVLVGCFCRDDENKVFWAVNGTIGCPIDGQVGDMFNYTYVDPNEADNNPKDGTVTQAEFISYVNSIQPGGSSLTERWLVTESIVVLQ
jgi:hypothetical protein